MYILGKGTVEENAFACQCISISITGSDWAVCYFCFPTQEKTDGYPDCPDKLLRLCFNEATKQ